MASTWSRCSTRRAAFFAPYAFLSPNSIAYDLTGGRLPSGDLRGREQHRAASRGDALADEGKHLAVDSVIPRNSAVPLLGTTPTVAGIAGHLRQRFCQLAVACPAVGCRTGNAQCARRSRLVCDKMLKPNVSLDIGRLHHVPVQPHSGTALLLTVRLVPEQCSSEAQGLAMRWMRLEKLLRRRQGCAALEVGNRTVWYKPLFAFSA